ncbi:MAG: hypothetical protein WCA46_10200 [Actinocatenispora sp.]
MTDPTSGGGYSSTDEPTTRRLPLRSPNRPAPGDSTGQDPWRPTTPHDDNPFAGSALGALPDSTSSVNPFSPSSGGPSALDIEPEQRRARTSVPAVFGMMLSLIAACAALTAWLAPAVIAVGGLGVLLSVISLFTARPAHVGGRLMALLAILIGLAAVGLGVADHLGTFSWLDHDLPKHARDWINDRVPFLH